MGSPGEERGGALKSTGGTRGRGLGTAALPPQLHRRVFSRLSMGCTVCVSIQYSKCTPSAQHPLVRDPSTTCHAPRGCTRMDAAVEIRSFASQALTDRLAFAAHAQLAGGSLPLHPCYGRCAPLGALLPDQSKPFSPTNLLHPILFHLAPAPRRSLDRRRQPAFPHGVSDLSFFCFSLTPACCASWPLLWHGLLRPRLGLVRAAWAQCLLRQLRFRAGAHSWRKGRCHLCSGVLC